MQTYYLDESGHDGDLISAPDLAFAGQPMFALASIGVNDPDSLATELEVLRDRHRCGKGELKAKDLGAKLGPIARDLTRWLVAHDAAVFVEVVEKRYFLAIHVVNRLLCGSYSLNDVDQASRQRIAEHLHGQAYDAVLLGYLAACRSERIEDVRSLLNLLWSALDASDDDVARDGQLLTMYARDRACCHDANTDDFLPLPDEGPTGKKVWMLPNLQCLTNIYGRINQSRRHGLDGVELVHDVQLQYGKVLEDAKALLETLAAQNAMPVVPFSDYQLRGTASLRFAASTDEPGLQAADILAGCVMRYARSGCQRRKKADRLLKQAVLDIYGASNPFLATGINFVISDQVLDRLDIPHLGNFGWLVRAPL